ncbi:MAG TPA: CDP-alcohol phosphatidyltransferase family protein [Thermodesulfobacteriota bacterium]|nr:CDP-alcohol phosphatidyltransferase family protein [Thermodesulfobacteriota bacterium]
MDLLPSAAFHPVEDLEHLDKVVDALDLPIREGVLVLKTDHVVDKYSLIRLTETAVAQNLYSLGATEKREEDGIYVVPPADLVPILRILWSPSSGSPNILCNATQVRGALGLPYRIEKGADQTKVSEAKLVAALRFHTEERDGFLARHLDRRVSRFVSKRLAHTRAAPNQITLAGMTIGLVGALLLSQPGYWRPLIGSVLFLSFAVMDGVDGEVSRLRLLDSQFGYYLDMITDNIVNVAIFSGIAFGLYQDTGDRIYLKVLLFLILGFGLCAISVYYSILRRSEDELKQSPQITRFMALLTNSDFAYIVVACAFIHRLNWFLIATAVGTYLFAATLSTMTLYKRRKTSCQKR